MKSHMKIAKGARKQASPIARIEDALAAFREGKMIGSILLGDAGIANNVKAAIEGERDFSSVLTDTVSVEQVVGAL